MEDDEEEEVGIKKEQRAILCRKRDVGLNEVLREQNASVRM